MTGKEKCEFLKEIRMRMAELNGIPYEPRECHHEGDCAGTCPMCDKEAAELMTKLKEKESEGAEIKTDIFSIEAIENPFRGSNNPLVTEKDLHEIRQDLHREREPYMGDVPDRYFRMSEENNETKVLLQEEEERAERERKRKGIINRFIASIKRNTTLQGDIEE